MIEKIFIALSWLIAIGIAMGIISLTLTILYEVANIIVRIIRRIRIKRQLNKPKSKGYIKRESGYLTNSYGEFIKNK